MGVIRLICCRWLRRVYLLLLIRKLYRLVWLLEAVNLGLLEFCDMYTANDIERGSIRLVSVPFFNSSAVVNSCGHSLGKVHR